MYTSENENSCGREKSRLVRVCVTSSDELSTASSEVAPFSDTLTEPGSGFSLISMLGERAWLGHGQSYQ